MQHLTSSERETQNLGENFAKKCKGGEIFLLSGELGGGKTQFVKGLAKGLGVKDHVTSPTFNYEKVYPGKALTLHHFDLYREETLDTDIKELMKEAFSDKKSIVAIEWSERMGNFRPSLYTDVLFEWAGENKRKILINEK